jgi:hypothetical protein
MWAPRTLRGWCALAVAVLAAFVAYFGWELIEGKTLHDALVRSARWAAIWSAGMLLYGWWRSRRGGDSAGEHTESDQPRSRA